MAATKLRRWLIFGGALSVCLPLAAAVLPEDRADVLYHAYDGGGVEISGPSLLLRKTFKDLFSVSANYYVDDVTSASIDVVTTASAYTEKRTQTSLGLDYLRGKTTLSGNFTRSSENDYEANTASFSISQDMFGDLTTVRLGYSLGWDTVGRNGDDNFKEDVRRQHYRLGVSQILTKSLLLDLSWEAITDEGFLNNPYRQVRFIDDGNPNGYGYQPELYPHTRTSNAVALRGLYYLPYRAVLKAGYRYFTDTWGIDAHTVELGYSHPIKERWIVDLGYRWYSQTAADFYSDLFPYQDAQNFLARDKELSTFTSHTFSLGLSYQFAQGGWGFIDRGSLNLGLDHVRYEYDDFRDLRADGVPAGSEPLYSYSANVLKLFISLWY